MREGGREMKREGGNDIVREEKKGRVNERLFY